MGLDRRIGALYHDRRRAPGFVAGDVFVSCLYGLLFLAFGRYCPFYPGLGSFLLSVARYPVWEVSRRGPEQRVACGRYLIEGRRGSYMA